MILIVVVAVALAAAAALQCFDTVYWATGRQYTTSYAKATFQQ